MAKDPAFLFYASDFLTGVQDLTFEERGQYITLLCIEHQKGRLSDKLIKLSIGNATADVLAKFKQDENGLFYNERLEQEIQKRKEHSEKQRVRAIEGWKKRKDSQSHGSATALPLENRNENEIEIIIDSLNEILNTKYKKSEKTKKLIKARLNEGFSVDDFKSVIYFKKKQWSQDIKMREYLRPETLFSNKFESYLQSSKINSQPPFKMQY